MFQINIYQKDNLLNQVIKTYEILTKYSYNADTKFVLSMYQKIQKMKYGESLPVNESVRLDLDGSESYTVIFIQDGISNIVKVNGGSNSTITITQSD